MIETIQVPGIVGGIAAAVSLNPLTLLLFFVALTLLLHYLLVWRRNLSDVAWKRVDYGWLLAAVFAVLAASATEHRSLYRNDLLMSGYALRDASQLLGLSASSEASSSACRIYAAPSWDYRTDWVLDIDGVTDPVERLCRKFYIVLAYLEPVSEEGADIVEKWVKLVMERYPFEGPRIFGMYFEVSPHSFLKLGLLDGPDAKSVAPQTRKALINYEAAFTAWTDMSNRVRWSSWASVLSLFWPLLLAIALALRFTKVTGDIRNARLKSQPAELFEMQSSVSVEPPVDTSGAKADPKNGSDDGVPKRLE